MRIGQKVKELRKKVKLTQQEFAEKIGVNTKTIAFWETERNEPTKSNILTICNKFNLPENYFEEYFTSEVAFNNLKTSENVTNEKFFNIPYWELLPEHLKSLEVDYIPVQRKVIEVGWKLNPEKLRIVPMVGDKMQSFWYQISEDDLLIIDTNQNEILGNGVYFATSQNNTRFWVREMQNLINNDVQIKGYALSGETVKTFTRQELADVDFRVIGKVIKNVSFRL